MSRTEPIVPASGSQRPGPADVRIVALADVVDAALASLDAFYGDAWLPGTPEPSDVPGYVLVHGTLIVPVPVK